MTSAVPFFGGMQGAGGLLNEAGFILPLADAGAGAVDTGLMRGTGSATFTRADDTATTVNSSGLIIQVAANIARSYYDPTTLAYQGYLSEGARTNLVLNSLIDGTDFSTQSVAVTAVAHTLSFYGTGTITLSGASTAGPLVGTGVYPQRVSLTFTPSAASLTLTVSGSCKYVQLEVGSFASSFIPTAGASVTRNADVLTYTFAGNADATVGTAYAELSTFQATQAAGGRFISTSAGTTEMLAIGASAASTTIFIRDGTNTVTKTGLTAMNGTPRKRASAWGGSTMTVTGDGAAVASGSFDGNIGSTAIALGCDTAGSNQAYCTIKNIRIWQNQFTDAQLQAVTN